MAWFWNNSLGSRTLGPLERAAISPDLADVVPSGWMQYEEPMLRTFVRSLSLVAILAGTAAAAADPPGAPAGKVETKKSAKKKSHKAKKKAARKAKKKTKRAKKAAA